MKPIGGVSSVLLALACAALTGAAPALSTLQPGAFQTLRQTIPVNIVFVGYEPGAGVRDIDESRFRRFLPKAYAVRNRYKAFYGLASDAGLRYDYAFNIVYAPPSFEDTFFGYLKSIATPSPLTFYQSEYNRMQKRSLTVANNFSISADLTEKWLAQNAPALMGVNTSHYTVFFLNWWGRADFKHHVYTKTNEADPDTGFPFGTALSSRRVIAWGGTAANDAADGGGAVRRVWFYDLSAGPEWWAGNFDVDNKEVLYTAPNGVMDYRIPPVWEYGNANGYRPFNDLSGDLGRVTRFVAVDLLFTTSPLYKPAISAPKIPQAVQLDVNMFDQSTANSPALFHTAMAASNLARLQPLNAFAAQVNRYASDNRTASVFHCFATDQESCYGNRLFNIAFGDLFLYFNDHLLQYIDNTADYEIPIFTFNTGTSLGGLLGFADDNWRDGTQSFVFGFLDPLTRPRYGFTSTLIHETGHHLGMSHPHDGYDSELNIDFGPSDAFYFAWSGDESSTIMSYIDLNYDFSQFDQDNMNRYLTAIFLNEANQVLAKILASPRAFQVSAAITAADAQAAAAVASLQAYDYPNAAAKASSAYRGLLAAAAAIHVAIEPQSSQADYRAKGRSYHFVDSADRHRFPVEP